MLKSSFQLRLCLDILLRKVFRLTISTFSNKKGRTSRPSSASYLCASCSESTLIGTFIVIFVVFMLRKRSGLGDELLTAKTFRRVQHRGLRIEFAVRNVILHDGEELTAFEL